ncbi:MAG: hypothetical protein KDD41_11645 [Flavobacteriales bacterium]|nr:hypothetical protein [Flavobacteriales bacterium]
MLYLLTLSAIIFSSCSKEEDNFRPTITVTSPSPSLVIQTPDTIIVKASIKDDHTIETVHVYLEDEQGNPVLSTISANPNTGSYELAEPFYFNDLHLPSGYYYFKFRAYDGKNTATETIKVIVNEATKTRNGIFLADDAGGTNNIYLLDNAFQASNYNSYPGNFLSMAVNSYHQRLMVVPGTTGNYISVDLNSGNPSWTSSPSNSVTGFITDQNYSYLGFSNGDIKRYNTSGASNFHGSANPGYYVEAAAIHDDYLVCEEQAISSSDVQLVLRWLASGATAQQASINEDILGIYTRDPNTLILITNNSSALGNLIFYDISTGLTSSPFAINTAKIDACTEISEGQYLVAENGDLTLINANNFSTLTYLTGIPATLLQYDELTNELWVANGNQLSIYNYPTKTLKGSYTHSSTMKGLDFWYNK